MKKVKIAILGSCVSRDNFNTKFNANYKDFYECVLLQVHSSVISIMSNPVDFAEEKLDNLNNYQLGIVKSELDKSFLREVKELQPDYLMLDFFGDIHFGVFQMENGEYLTYNRWNLLNTSFYKELKNTKILQIHKNPDEYFEVWKKYIDALFVFLKKELPNTKIIVNKARNAEFYIDKTNAKKPLNKTGKMAVIDVPYFNQLWDKLDKYVIEKYNTEYIDLTDKEYLSYESHPWGLFYLHYTMDFYSDFLGKLHGIVMKNLQEKLHKEKELNQEIQKSNLEIQNSNRELLKNTQVLQKSEEALKKSINSIKKDNKKLTKIVKRYETETFIHAVKRYMLKINLIREINNLVKRKKTSQ